MTNKAAAAYPMSCGILLGRKTSSMRKADTATPSSRIGSRVSQLDGMTEMLKAAPTCFRMGLWAIDHRFVCRKGNRGSAAATTP